MPPTTTDDRDRDRRHTIEQHGRHAVGMRLPEHRPACGGLSPVPKAMARKTCPAVMTVRGSTTIAAVTKAAPAREILLAAGATTNSGAATRSANCWDRIAKAQRTPASIHRSRRAQPMPHNASPSARRSWGGRRSGRTSRPAGDLLHDEGHRLPPAPPRPDARSHAITPAISASQLPSDPGRWHGRLSSAFQ